MSVRVKVKEVDERIGSPLARAVREGRNRGVVHRATDAARKATFHRDRLGRRLRHRDHYDPSGADPSALSALRRDGYVIMRDVLDRDLLRRISDEFESYLDAGAPFDKAPHDALRSAGERGNTDLHVPSDDMRRGQGHYRNLTNRVTLSDPMITCPSIIPVAFHPPMYRLASAYFKTVPAVGSATLRKSFANDLPVFDTLLFHIDPNSPRLLKCFVYLHDVDEGGGPFSYVRGSHRKRFAGARRHKRWRVEEIARAYGESEIVSLTARAGDVVVADTSGFHRGTKPRTADRSMITTSYVVHPEYGGRYPRNKISPAGYDRIPSEARPAADLLDVVEPEAAARARPAQARVPEAGSAE